MLGSQVCTPVVLVTVCSPCLEWYAKELNKFLSLVGVVCSMAASSRQTSATRGSAVPATTGSLLCVSPLSFTDKALNFGQDVCSSIAEHGFNMHGALGWNVYNLMEEHGFNMHGAPGLMPNNENHF